MEGQSKTEVPVEHWAQGRYEVDFVWVSVLVGVVLIASTIFLIRRLVPSR